MKQYTLILVGDERSPVRRFQVSQKLIRGIVWTVVIFVAGLGLGSWDYVRMRVDNRELDGLRTKTAEQVAEMAKVRSSLDQMSQKMNQVRELERKVRIIANLPGAAGVGGSDVTEMVPEDTATPTTNGLPIPAGVPVEIQEHGDEEPHARLDPIDDPAIRDQRALQSDHAKAMRQLQSTALDITSNAEVSIDSFGELVLQLEDKRSRLVSMPSVWPAQGWLTSRYGPRVSPFTNKRQHHAGIDIAAEPGTPVVAPADGKVTFAGRKGPLGNTVIIDHGFGVRTMFGHNQKLYVKKGSKVARGELISAIGSSGRSTGPHLHYVVEVDGKTRNPLDYIFD